MSNMPPDMQAESRSGGTPSWVTWAAVGVVAFLVILVVGAVLLAVFAETAGPAVAVVRDVFVILLLLTLIVLLVALVVLAVQVARYVSLLANETGPLIENAQDTVQVVRGTAHFLSKHLTEPVIKGVAAITALGRISSDVTTIRKKTRRTPPGRRDARSAAAEETEDEPRIVL